MTPLKAIRAHCLDCCCGSAHETKLCTVEKCSLWPYRFGKNPARKGIAGRGSFKANTAAQDGISEETVCTTYP